MTSEVANSSEAERSVIDRSLKDILDSATDILKRYGWRVRLPITNTEVSRVAFVETSKSLCPYLTIKARPHTAPYQIVLIDLRDKNDILRIRRNVEPESGDTKLTGTIFPRCNPGIQNPISVDEAEFYANVINTLDKMLK